METAAKGALPRPRGAARAPARALPPGPEAGPVAQTLAYHRRPLETLVRAQREYGDLFTLRLATARPLVAVAHPDEVVGLIESDPHRSRAGEGRRRILPQASAASVFGADGDGHRGARARLAAAFDPDRVGAHRERIEALAVEHLERWPRDRPLRLLPRLRLLTDEIFVRVILGIEGPRGNALAAAIRRMLATPGNPPISPPGEGAGLVGKLVNRLATRRMALLKTLLGREVAARRASSSAHQRTDALSLLVSAEPELADAEIVDELLAVAMAGQEPPAAAHAWILDRLGRDPELAARFAEDVATRDRVIRETLRLRPPANALLRRLTAETEIGGYVLPAGVTTMVPLALTHRDPRTFADPEEFRPERWRFDVDDPPTYHPFGNGARRCIGEPLARAELGTVIPTLLRRARFQSLWPEPERMVLRATILVPHRSALAVVEDR